MRFPTLLCVLALGPLTALACGGDDDPADPSPAGSSGKGGSAGSSGKGGSGGSAGSSGKGGSSGSSGAGQGGSAGSQGGSAGSGGSSGAGQGGSAGSTAGSAGQGGEGQSGSSGQGGAGQGGEGGSAGQAGSAQAGQAGSGQAGQGGSGAGAGGSAGQAGSAQAGAGQGGSAGSAGSAGAASGRWVMGYYPGYQNGDLPPENVRFDLMSHLAVGAVLPKNDGTLDTSFYLTPQQGPAFAKDLATRTHNAGKKAILMVGGAGAHDGFVAASQPATRATFVANLISFAKQNGFDGLDLDWEPLPPSELDTFAALASALRAAWPEAVLTLPLGGINVNFDTVDPKLASIAASLDQINLMTYSMAGPYDGWLSWHHTPLDGEKGQTPMSIQSSVDAYLAAGVPAAKLGIGEGFYGLCYTSPVTAPNQALNGANAIADDNQLSFRAIMTTYAPSGTKGWDDTAKSPYLSFSQPTGPLGCTYISYTDEQSIAAHAAYVKQKGLGGAIVWTINEGHLPGKPAAERDPLLAALWNGLKLSSRR